jgi:hypothetical protein
VGIGDALFLLIDEGSAEGEENPVAIGDEDVVKQFAEFRVFGGGRVLFYGSKKVLVRPAFVADELINQGKHGGNVAGFLDGYVITLSFHFVPGPDSQQVPRSQLFNSSSLGARRSRK